MNTVRNGWIGTVNPSVIDVVVVAIQKLTDSRMRREQNPGQVKQFFLWNGREGELDIHGSSGRIHVIILKFVCDQKQFDAQRTTRCYECPWTKQSSRIQINILTFDFTAN